MSYLASIIPGVFRRRAGGRMRARLRLGGGVLLAAAVVLGTAGPASASPARVPASAPAGHHLILRAMPAGTVTFGRTRHGRVKVHVRMHGLTPGSAHAAEIIVPGHRAIRLSPLQAASSGQAISTLFSNFRGLLRPGSHLVIRMGRGRSHVAREPIARTRRLARHRTYRLIAVEAGPAGRRFGTPHGHATVTYNAARATLRVVVRASGLTPGPHAAHIHQGTCWNQGPVRYMLDDLHANRHGRIVHAVRVFTHVTKPIPAHDWYLNIHQGNTNNITTPGGQPTIFFRPLLCAPIPGGKRLS